MYKEDENQRQSRDGRSAMRPRRQRIGSSEGRESTHRSFGDRTDRSNDTGNGYQRPYRPRIGNNRDSEPHYRSNDGERRSFRERNDGWNEGQRPARPRFGNTFKPHTNGSPAYRDTAEGFRRPYRKHSDDYDPNAKYSAKKRIEYKEALADPNAPIRLNRFLANAGVCSRREADTFIQAGVVTVNGQVVTELGTKVLRTDEVRFHDQTLSLEKKLYVLLNKPKGYVTTIDDPQERKTVMQLVKDVGSERIYPVGRLDRNTMGVLLLTNDGELASKLTHPKYLKKKIYHVFCDKNVTHADMEAILKGIHLDDGEIHADAISYVSDTDKSQVGIEIHSGRNRIVRRIFESLDYKVTKLDRVYFAGLTKKGLRRGDWRYLTEEELQMLKMGAYE